MDAKKKTRAVQGSKHSPGLQSIRGIAALIVVLHHCSFYFYYSEDSRHFFEIAYNAHAAVILFFVLSGFVLALSLQRSDLHFESLMKFFVKRGFRIYPALWFAVLLASFYTYLFFEVRLPASVDDWWHQASREVTPTFYSVPMALTGLGTQLPVPMWTLKIELFGSLLMPVLVWLMRHSIVALGAVTALLGALTLWDPFMGFFLPFKYMVHFALGVLVLAVVPLLRLPSSRQLRFVALGATLTALFAWAVLEAVFGLKYGAPVSTLIEGVASAVVVAMVYMSTRELAFLSHGILVWLGDISYSVYLLHLPIMALIAGVGIELLHLQIFAISWQISMTVLTLSTLAVTLPLSALVYRYIEIPGIKLGQQILTWVSTQFGQPRKAY